MGTCCFGNKPSEKFIGTWTDNQYVQLKIDDNGHINYQKNTPTMQVNFNGATRFKDEKFIFCCCCCALRGTINNDENDSEPTLIANGIKLTKI